MDFLTVREISQILKTHSNTVYKMCREGILPAVKIGKEWRIDRRKLALFMEGGAPPQQKDTYESLVQLSLQEGHLLGIFTQEKDISEFELTFFVKAQDRGYRLFKACWWQHPDDVRRHMSKAGLEVEKLESSGSLVIVDLNDVFRRFGHLRAAEVWSNAAAQALDLGYKGLISSGAKHMDCCGNHSFLMEFEKALDKIIKNEPIVGVCPYLMDMNVPNAFVKLVDLMKLHGRFFIQTQDTEILAQVTFATNASGRLNH
ncbi:hypothetical protein MNBD_NITROSPINAE04-2173 [hydrothermal vent metagenome]|uniref:Helix-turn-helix domain-containing protein n=1 Tax=hydrothermal vent metagenome TaxID=652676 RepID=A0A3B1BYJ8_9ZZZZ